MTAQIDLDLGRELRDMGIEAAKSPRYRAMLLKKARDIARALARCCHEGITADDVAAYCASTGIPFEALGNAAGGLFKGGDFEFTGEWRESPRAANHARAQRVWRLRCK